MPQDRPVADVMTVAKRDLRPGETLDEFGGYTLPWHDGPNGDCA